MAGPLPSVPTNLIVQTGNGETYLSWSPVVGSTAYNIYRSENAVAYTQVAASSTFYYYDSNANVGTQYFYKIQSASSAGVSNFTDPYTITPVDWGQASLGQLRMAAQQRADQDNSNFVPTEEWNSYINNSYTELYDLLVAVYGDEYFVRNDYTFTTDGRSPGLYPLPDDFYKMMGVDLTVNATQNGYLTLKKFTFAQRNQYLYGGTSVPFYGFQNVSYRIMGSNVDLIPTPGGNQTIRLWYVPKPTVLLADSDIIDGISGWWEYIVIDAAIKAMQKEESDVTVLLMQKEVIKKRIEAMASNRDQGMAEGVTDVRGGFSGAWGTFGNGPSGGF